MYPSFYPQHSASPITLIAHLEQHLSSAKLQVDSLTKSSFKNKTDEQAIAEIARSYQILPLELGKPSVKIEENYNFERIQDMPPGESFSLSGDNYRDIVRVFWPVSGDGELLDYRNANGVTLKEVRDGNHLLEKYVYAAGLRNDPKAGENIKFRMDNSTLGYQGVVDQLNATTAEFNKHLTASLLLLAKAKRTEVNKLDDLENFLNS